jgi:nitrite reductase/ring-hydroxylating ferredoxin subunit
MTTVPILSSDELAPGAMRHVRAGGLDLVAVHAGDEVHVLENVCPHAGAPLHGGTLDGFCLTCPWHGSQFDVRTGDVVRGPATQGLRRYPARAHDGWLVIDV